MDIAIALTYVEQGEMFVCSQLFMCIIWPGILYTVAYVHVATSYINYFWRTVLLCVNNSNIGSYPQMVRQLT